MHFEKLTVADLMSTALMTIKPGDTVDRADLEMTLAGVRHFPVVDDRNHLVGILSDRDLLRAFGLSTVESVAIGDVMTVDVQTTTVDAPAHEAVELLIDLKIGCLPVIGEEGQLVGLVTQTDFLEVAHRALLSAAESLAR